MANLNQGPGAFDFYSALSGLGDVFQANQKKALQREAFSADPATGTVDYSRALTTFVRNGDLDSAAKVAGIQKAIAPENTPDIQNYNFAVKNGYKGSLLDFAKEKAAAGAARTSVNTNIQSGEKEFDKAVGKDYGETFVGINKGARDSVGALNNLNLMEKITQDPNFYSGSGGEVVTKAKQLAASLGIADAASAAPNELFKKISQKSVLDSAGGSLGAGFSNADRSFLEGTVANIGNTPDGNRQIIGIARRVEQRKQEIAKFARDYAAKNGGRIDANFDSALADWTNKNPAFPQSAASAPAQPAQAQPQSNAPRQAPDGKLYVPDPNRPGKYLQVVQ
jgi:hypothetical protein